MDMQLFVDKDFTVEASTLYTNQVIYVQASVEYNATVQECVNHLLNYIKHNGEKILFMHRHEQMVL